MGLVNLRALLDRTPAASIGLALMREATGRDDPVEAIRPARAERLVPDARVGFWSLSAGMGASTVAALVAQRSASAGEAPILVDLDRWAPSLALRAGVEAATVCDALVQPDRERELISRWAGVAFLPGSPHLHRDYDGARVVALIERVARGRPAILDLGAGADALDPLVLKALTRLCVVTGTRAAQLQAAFCARELLAGMMARSGLVVVGAEREDAELICSRVRMDLLAAIPHDAFLARDEFAIRAPTMRAVDALIRAL